MDITELVKEALKNPDVSKITIEPSGALTIEKKAAPVQFVPQFVPYLSPYNAPYWGGQQGAGVGDGGTGQLRGNGDIVYTIGT